MEMGGDELSRFFDGIGQSVARTVAQLPAGWPPVEQYRMAPPMGAMQG
jgi:hypothetical protein